MSARIYIESNAIIPQPDFEATEGENGQWSGSQTFKIKKGDYDNQAIQLYFTRGRSAVDVDPNNDSKFSFLKVKTIGVGTEEGGYTVIKVDYQGYNVGSGVDPNNLEKPYTTYSLRGVTKSVPITEHPKYKALGDTDKLMINLLMSGDFTLNEDGIVIGQYVPYTDETAAPGEGNSMVLAIFTNPAGGNYELTEGDARTLAQIVSKGITDYEVGTFEYWVKWSGEVPLTSADIAQLGKISPPTGEPITPTGENRDWKLNTINQEQEGTENPTYSVEVGYILSDKGGFDDFLYGA